MTHAQLKTALLDYTRKNYGNLIKYAEPKFDNESKVWIAELESVYPRIIRDDAAPSRQFVKVMYIPHLGVIQLDEKNRILEATPRGELLESLRSSLHIWRSKAERIVLSATAEQLAHIANRNSLGRIDLILRNLLNFPDGVILDSKLEQLGEYERTEQYLRFLEQINLVKRIEKGYAAGQMLVQFMEMNANPEKCLVLALAYILKDHYQSIRQQFRITTFEPYIRLDSCYYGLAIQAEKLVRQTQDSIISQYQYWYGRRSEVATYRLGEHLNELVGVDLLKRERNYYVGHQDLLDTMLEKRDELKDTALPAIGSLAVNS